MITRVVNMPMEKLEEAIARWELVRDQAIFDGERAVAVRMIGKYEEALRQAQAGKGAQA